MHWNKSGICRWMLHLVISIIRYFQRQEHSWFYDWPPCKPSRHQSLRTMLQSLLICQSQRYFLLAFQSYKLLWCFFPSLKYAGSCWVLNNNLTAWWMSCSSLFSFTPYRHKDSYSQYTEVLPYPFTAHGFKSLGCIDSWCKLIFTGVLEWGIQSNVIIEKFYRNHSQESECFTFYLCPVVLHSKYEAVHPFLFIPLFIHV